MTALAAAACADPLRPTAPAAAIRTATQATSAGPFAPAHAPGQCLEVAEASREAGTPLQLGACTGVLHQQFTFPAAGEAGEVRAFGGAGAPPLCLEADGRAGLHDDPVVTGACTGAPAQRWTRTLEGELRHAVAGRCLDAGSGREAGTPATLADCTTGRPGQGWLPGGPPAGRAEFGKALVAGYEHTCGLTAAGRAYCWGWNNVGQLGDSVYESPGVRRVDRPAPHPVSGGLTFVQLAAGLYHTCGLTPEGRAYCWGAYRLGQLGIGTPANNPQVFPTPTPVAGGLTFASIAAGWEHTCALTAAGEAYCWGANGQGQVGDGTVVGGRYTPTRVLGDLSITGLALGLAHSCGVTTSGRAYCWGAAGPVGDGSDAPAPRATPVAVAQGAVRYTQITGGYNHTCALTSAGQAYCWGGNSNGQLGDSSNSIVTRYAPVPVRQPEDVRFARVDAGLHTHTCGLTRAGQSYCWGWGANGQFGDGSRRALWYPVPAGGGLRWVEQALGRHSCSLRPDGAAFCWGDNRAGQVGDGIIGGDRLVPVAAVGGVMFRVPPRAGETSACSADGRFCLRAGLRYDADDEFQAFTRFEERVGDEWMRRDARDISVVCYVDGVVRDQDAEEDASLVDLRFQVRRPGGPTGDPPPVLVACEHAADGGAYRAATRVDGRPAEVAVAVARALGARR